VLKELKVLKVLQEMVVFKEPKGLRVELVVWDQQVVKVLKVHKVPLGPKVL
jgi:hypothetical protein